MKKVLVVVVLIVLVVPVADAASPAKSTPAKDSPSPQKAGENPAKACKAERSDIGIDAFAKKYGTNHNLRNAFGKCVSGKSKGRDETEKGEKDEDEQGERDDDGSSQAVKQCKKARADMSVETFATKYGTNHNKANAFGKCVSLSSKNTKHKTG